MVDDMVAFVKTYGKNPDSYNGKRHERILSGQQDTDEIQTL